MMYLTLKFIMNPDVTPRRDMTVPNTMTEKASLKMDDIDHQIMMSRIENLIELQVGTD